MGDVLVSDGTTGSLCGRPSPSVSDVGHTYPEATQMWPHKRKLGCRLVH